MPDFTTAELRAMTTVLVSIVDETDEMQDLILRTVRLVDQLPLSAFTALRSIGEALQEIPIERRLAILDHLVEGKSLVNPPPTEGQAVM